MRTEYSKKENQLTVWIIASILFHLLLGIVILMINLEKQHQAELQQIEKQKTLTPQELQEEANKLLHRITPEDQCMLMPGQASTLFANPKSQQTSQSAEAPSPQKDNPKKNTESLSKQKINTDPLPSKKKVSVAPPTIAEKPINPLLKKIHGQLKDHSSQKSQINPIHRSMEKPEEKQEIRDNQKAIKKKINLQDLKMGFSKYINQQGNSDVLIQHGNINVSPSMQDLKRMSYNRQFALTMTDSIKAHDHYHHLKVPRGTKMTISITIDRNGKLLNRQIFQGTGNDISDKIILESIEQAGLYPQVPKHIPDDPLQMTWTICF